MNARTVSEAMTMIIDIADFNMSRFSVGVDEILYYPNSGEHWIVTKASGSGYVTVKLLSPRISWWRRLLGRRYVPRSKDLGATCVVTGYIQ